VSFLKKTSPALVRRIDAYTDKEPLFDRFELQPTIDSALKRTLMLPSGGHNTIDKTEALTAIDVNTGRFVGKRSLEDTIVKTNLEAAEECVRQLRLRDIGGIIVIDFIDMESAQNRNLLTARLNELLDRDRTKTRVTEISRLGLVEMTRKNVTDGLYGVLTEPCPHCGGDGRVLSQTTRRISVERRMRELLSTGKSGAYLFGLNPDTYELVMAPGRNLVPTLRAQSGKQVSVVPDADVAPTEVRVLIEGRTGLFHRSAEV
jgi:ribonuclease G